jgi:dienelactone hydrolase
MSGGDSLCRDGAMNSRIHNRGLETLAVVLAAVVFGGCYGTLRLEESDHPTVLAQQVLKGDAPSTAGEFTVLTLTYGSGTDKNREEYGEGVAFRTDSVDASKLISLGSQADDRNGYWGFTPEGFPLNARVWYPEGEGPFPLVLVVHGNHDPRDFSDPGYDYLGELLASRGYILASIDMNFVNGGIRNENDSRGWLLLKHVQAFEGFNEDEANPFFGKVDMSSIALMGHSRGGEAVTHAAAFNRLTHYPDDASLRFDFDFDIKSIVAIAPVDGQYLPTDRHVPLENVSYMVFHGSHDGDVTSFHGTRAYNRLRFTDGEEHLKAAIYVYRANHGQWNSVWKNKDNGPRSSRILDLRGLLDTEEQLEFGRIYISAFLDYTLKGDRDMLPLFRDHRVAGDWLPKTMYITRFQDSSYRALAEFDEDIDVTTGSVAGVTLVGDSLSTWRERTLNLRSSNRVNTSSSQQSQAAWLGWNNEVEGSDEMGPAAQFRVMLPDTLGRAWQLNAAASVEISLTGIEATPGPRKPAVDEDGAGEAQDPAADADAESETTDSDDDDADAEKAPIDLSIEMVDASGRTASVPLSNYGPVRRPLETRVLRRADQEERRFANLFELLLQSYSIPFTDFLALTPDLDVRSLAEIRLVFDRSEAGTVVVDDIGIAFLDPAYTAARIDPKNPP